MKLILLHSDHQLNYFKQIKGLDKSEYDIKLSSHFEADTSKYESVLCIFCLLYTSPSPRDS